MTLTGTATLPTLPHWERPPADLKAAISDIKNALRARIAASGRNIDEVFAVMERRVTAAVEEVLAAKARGEAIWPVIEYADIAAGRVSAEATRSATTSRLPRRPRALRAVAGASVGSGHRRLRREQPVLRELSRPRRRLLRQRGFQARDLPDLLVAGANASSPKRAHGERAGLPQQSMASRVRRRAVVRPEPRFALSRSHPSPAAGSGFEGTRRTPRPRDAGSLDDRGLPKDLPSPLRRQRRAVRSVGRLVSHGRATVSRHDDVFGIPHVPGLDGAVRHGPRPGRSPHGAYPRGDGLPHAAGRCSRTLPTTT